MLVVSALNTRSMLLVELLSLEHDSYVEMKAYSNDKPPVKLTLSFTSSIENNNQLMRHQQIQ
jgi:hypothetical protein